MCLLVDIYLSLPLSLVSNDSAFMSLLQFDVSIGTMPVKSPVLRLVLKFA